MIPSKYLSKLDNYTVKIEGVEIKVKVVHHGSSSSFLESYLNDIKLAIRRSPVQVVGVDIIRRPSDSTCSAHESIVLCVGAAATCLIVHLPEYRYLEAFTMTTLKVPEVLIEFLEDSSICFVGSTRRPCPLVRGRQYLPRNPGVEAGHLAARVFKNPSLSGLSLAELSRLVGVQYNQHEAAAEGTGVGVSAVKDPSVFTEDQVKVAVNDAYAYYNIGHKLLGSH